MRRKDPKDAKQKGDEIKKAPVHKSGNTFRPAKDSRQRKVRGLWIRGEKFYAQMRLRLPDGTSKAVRIPLEATRLDDAVAEAEKKRTEKRGGEIKLPGVRPTFAVLVKEYLESNIGTRRNRGKGYLSKSDSTRRHEKQSLDRWILLIGGKRIDWIQDSDLVAFVNRRTREGVTNRTINLDLIAFNNVMGYAVRRKLIKTPPRLEKQNEEEPPPKRLLQREEVRALIEQAKTPATLPDGSRYHAKHGQQLALFLRLLASSGCREQEALKILRRDVDLEGEKLTIQAINTKSGKKRVIHFNDDLRAVLVELVALSKKIESQWLFPSPIRGKEDRPADTLRQSFNMVRTAAEMPDVGFHHFRHYFASQAVMRGIDFMTIARVLGHQDGGILVGKVYGHLSEEHQRTAAAKMGGLA